MNKQSERAISTQQSLLRRALIVSSLVMIGASIARAGVTEVDSFHVGGFYDLDASGMALTPDNDMSFQNYFMGHTTVPGFTTTERRSFFAFDLGSVMIPDGEEIISMSLVLENVFGGVMANFATGGMEVAEFTSTSASYDAIADPMSAGMAPEEIFDTFGSGSFFGDFVWGMDGPPPGPAEVVLSEAAIMDAMAALGADEVFTISGKLATYDPLPGVGLEFVFGLTDVVVDGMPTGFPVPKLVITTGPVPAPPGVMVLGAGLLLGARRRR